MRVNPGLLTRPERNILHPKGEGASGNRNRITFKKTEILLMWAQPLGKLLPQLNP